MVDPQKVAAVREYLQSEFPGNSVEDWYDSMSNAQCFRVVAQGATYQTMISDEFLARYESTAIGPKLGSFTLAEHLRDLPSEAVIVTSTGLKLEY